MNMNKDLNINYIKYGIILVVIVIISIGSTLAYYSWGSTANTNFSIEVLADVIRIMYDGGPDITGANLFPTDDKENDGIKKEITVSVDRYSEHASYNLYLDLKTLPDGLKNESFKYEFYQGSSLIKSGNFKNPTTSTCTKNSTNHIVLVSNVTPTTTLVTYTLYIWIDGVNYTNPDTMMNQSFEFILHADGENVSDGTSSSGGSGGATTLALGDYVSYTPVKTSATTNTAYTGYISTQTINPSELNLWRVLNINDDGTIDLISEYVSSVNIYFRGQTGYQNLVGELNRLASQYETSGITTRSRYFGYNGQTEYITDTSKFVNPAPWTASTSDNSNESQGGGDTLYTTDYNQVNTVLGTRKANKVGTTTATSYWMASRYYSYNSSTLYYWHGRRVSTSGLASRNDLYYSNGSSFDTYDYNNALRPIVTLKSGLEYSGLGTESVPMEIITS